MVRTGTPIYGQHFLIDNYLYNLITNLQIGIVGPEKDVIVGYRIGAPTDIA